MHILISVPYYCYSSHLFLLLFIIIDMTLLLTFLLSDAVYYTLLLRYCHIILFHFFFNLFLVNTSSRLASGS